VEASAEPVDYLEGRARLVPFIQALPSSNLVLANPEYIQNMPNRSAGNRFQLGVKAKRYWALAGAADLDLVRPNTDGKIEPCHGDSSRRP
jgi:hypothetical protein